MLLSTSEWMITIQGVSPCLSNFDSFFIVTLQPFIFIFYCSVCQPTPSSRVHCKKVNLCNTKTQCVACNFWQLTQWNGTAYHFKIWVGKKSHDFSGRSIISMKCTHSMIVEIKKKSLWLIDFWWYLFVRTTATTTATTAISLIRFNFAWHEKVSSFSLICGQKIQKHTPSWRSNHQIDFRSVFIFLINYQRFIFFRSARVFGGKDEKNSHEF